MPAALLQCLVGLVNHRLSREGVLSTLTYLQRLTSYGIKWRSFTEQYIDSCGVFADAVISIMAVIAKQENIRRSERTRAGLCESRSETPGTTSQAERRTYRGDRQSARPGTLRARDCTPVEHQRGKREATQRSCVINVTRNWPLTPLDLVAFFFVWSASQSNVYVARPQLKKHPPESKNQRVRQPGLSGFEAPC